MISTGDEALDPALATQWTGRKEEDMRLNFGQT